MTAITIPNIDNAMRLRLQARAAKHGHSIETEARDILHAALNEDEVTSSSLNLYEAIAASSSRLVAWISSSRPGSRSGNRHCSSNSGYGCARHKRIIRSHEAIARGVGCPTDGQQKGG